MPKTRLRITNRDLSYINNGDVISPINNMLRICNNILNVLDVDILNIEANKLREFLDHQDMGKLNE